MMTSCGACGKLMRYSQPIRTCSGKGCKAMAHYACVGTLKQNWRCVSCSYPTETSVQYLLGEILKKGSGLELLHGLIGKINELLNDINAIRDENETLKQEISLLSYAKEIDIPKVINNKPVNNETNDIVSNEEESSQYHHDNKQTLNTKISIFVTCSNTTQSETNLREYLEDKTKIDGIECVRVSCYDSYSMFQIKVDQCHAHLLTKSDVYPVGCKLELYGR